MLEYRWLLEVKYQGEKKSLSFGGKDLKIVI